MKELIIRPIASFSANGKLKGSLAAYDPESDSRSPLWESDSPNWRAKGEIEAQAARMARELAEDFPEFELDEKRAQALLRSALRAARQAQAAEDENGGANELSRAHELPVIVVDDRHLREIAQDSWQLLQAPPGSEPDFFTFGDTLAHLERDDDRVYARVLKREALIGHLDRLADYIHAGEGETPARVPKDVVDDMLASAQLPVPRLEAVVHTPVLGAGGTAITTSGYHTDVGLYLNLAGLKVPAVPETPLPTDVERARHLIADDLLGDFPFASPSDQAHAIATLLCPVVRPLIDGPTPLHLIDAPSPGTGKGLLAEVAVFVATGGVPAMMPEGGRPEEWRKKITSTLLEAPDVIVIDNIRDRLDAAPLAVVLTTPVWQDRLLGVSRNVRLPVRCTWIATGNNVTLSLEMARRTIVCRLDSSQERPWERTGFRHDPLLEWAQAHRGDLCWALMTMARAWIAAGRPEPSVRLGTFEAWSRVIGGILKVASIPGFLENRGAVYAQAEAEHAGWLAFIAVWAEQYSDARVGVEELFTLAREEKLLTDLRAGRGDQGARVTLGLELAKMRDRRIGDYWIRDTGRGHGGGMTYRLDTANKNLSARDNAPPNPSPPSPSLGVGFV